MLYSCYIARCGNLRTKLRPQRRSATSDAQSITLVQILPSAMPTPTHICHLGCPERYSRADSAVRNADPNTNLPSRMPRALLACRFCRWRRRPQSRSITSDAETPMPALTLHPTTSAAQNALQEHAYLGSVDPGNVDPNSKLPTQMPGEPVSSPPL